VAIALKFPKFISKELQEIFAYKYYLVNQARLNGYKTAPAFAKDFSLTEEDWKFFVKTAAEDSISLTAISIKERKDLEDRIKSSIARQLWRNEGYYEVMNMNDNAVKKAMEILHPAAVVAPPPVKVK
jgi:carboxyl-terminal processing protease